MLVRDKKTGRFLSKKESERILEIKRQQYHKQILEEMKKEPESAFAEHVIIALTAFLTICIVGVILFSISGCAPRSEIYCIDSKGLHYVPCPKGKKPGSRI